MSRLVLTAALLLATIAATPAPAPAATATAAAPAAHALPSLIINGVLIAGVEYDTPGAVWRNLGVTVTNDRVAQWRALGASDKSRYAQKIIDDYRAGTGYAANIKLTFVTEQNGTLDQYLWTPPSR